MWEQGKTIAQIASSIGLIDEHDPNGDPYHSLRNFLYRMHTIGYRDVQGNIVKLPYRVKKATLRAFSKAGAYGMVVKRRLARKRQLSRAKRQPGRRSAA